MKNEENKAEFICPNCKSREKINIPTDRCLYFYKCKSCGKLIKTPQGSCCIVCSFTDKKCPVSTVK